MNERLFGNRGEIQKDNSLLFSPAERVALSTLGGILDGRAGEAVIYGSALNPKIAFEYGLMVPPCPNSDIDVEVRTDENPSALAIKMAEKNCLVSQLQCCSDGAPKLMVTVPRGRRIEISFRVDPPEYSPNYLHSLRLGLNCLSAGLESPLGVSRENLFLVPRPQEAFHPDRGARAKIAGLIAIATPLIWGEEIPSETIRTTKHYMRRITISSGVETAELNSLLFWYFEFWGKCDQVGSSKEYERLVFRQAKILPRNFCCG